MAYICPNNYNKTILVIVSLVTRNSEIKEEFISLKGLCESTYSSFCKAFVDEILAIRRAVVLIQVRTRTRAQDYGTPSLKY